MWLKVKKKKKSVNILKCINKSNWFFKIVLLFLKYNIFKHLKPSISKVGQFTFSSREKVLKYKNTWNKSKCILAKLYEKQTS